ncbi:uncharacterized protein LOC129570210 isoform X1 [Sitodiplosis mosellana]|uniref:uncharacterized protein LOC129570210 isoform X1 n=1 Tax=Sitodiplosis mosellana TaxID=263140 RepID=UPI002444F6AD|nr:uncharacterized protein LOC129570210 isoform X1 [Sitodiplosis mosellana]XP_055305703.1 uncharacterized protein LOC129570210 isoform X1 [Sitodiplosis mosellana]XP_055305704.1 uncharacterized protein LOC129570210 isoform X1 [Sitodiplosis mosellana]XP_055305705.1 uncharacterized protein LOC129570210 isoform X1 [Sitodiplosis mosellana]
MYAAAGGASLASRQKRKNQAAQNVKNKALLQQGLKDHIDKLAASRASNLAPKAQSRPFHNLPSSYLRAPQAHVRKLSAGYTTQNKILVPINESNNQYFAHFHNHHHHAHEHPSLAHEHHQNRPVSPRPSSSAFHPNTQRLTKSATASIPLVTQYDQSSPPDSPLLLKHHVYFENDNGDALSKINVPCIVTPATPLPSPGPPTAEQLERKCSFYRGKHLAYEDLLKTEDTDFDEEYQIKQTAKQNILERWTDSECCDSEHQHSICTCDHIECAQGRSAWQLERGRRCSVSENPASCHRRWVKRNRIHDSSLGSSDDDDFLGALRGPSSFANAFLYVGLGTVALGLVIVFVGTGEKGFKTVELRLIGPSLIGIGLLCCILRIFFCICPSNCISSNRRKMKQKNAKVDVDHTTSLLCADNKRVSIARTAQTQYPQEALDFLKKHPNSKMNEGMETLREIATTSLFLQSEKNNFTSAIDPRKNEEKLEVISISDEEENGALVKLNHNFHGTASILDAAIKTPDTSFVLEPVREEQTRPNKLSRSRAPLNQQKCKNTSSTKIVLSTMDETSLTSTGHNENDVGYASTTLSLVPSQPLVPSLLVDGNSLALNRMDTIKPTQASTTQSVVTSFASSFEPELVLSPAKLGQ